ncbi:MAG TPA: hypothetical protein PLY70_02335 [Saprospiraceae bacterium]|nr:hypothetical protein [Saprospiraceae bacterium]
MASTNDVNVNGSITQNHSGLNIKKAMVPITDTIKYIQYFFNSLFDDVIL